jgi:S-adenosylmethionine:tRNA ribosyltransferase-isomerase
VNSPAGLDDAAVSGIADFDYELPDTAIAQSPVSPRDTSRLLDTRDMSDHRFSDLPCLLAPGDLVVVNHTKVRSARLRGTKRGSGGVVEALVLRRLDPMRWEALVRPARRLRAGSVVDFGDIEGRLLSDPIEGRVTIELRAPDDIEAAIERHGEMPLPPYIRSRLEDDGRYQTIFASRPGSAAAPTAGLHFTPQVVGDLEAAGIRLAAIDLEVGIATFRPIATEKIEDHVMHSETYELSDHTAAEIDACRVRGGRVIAVGTTTVRVLESRRAGAGRVEPGRGETSLYLRPGSRFEVVDLLVTNFHMPRSSLIVLVAAFMGPEWKNAYLTALGRGYRFLSFGDAMVCERRDLS